MLKETMRLELSDGEHEDVVVVTADINVRLYPICLRITESDVSNSGRVMAYADVDLTIDEARAIVKGLCEAIALCDD